MEIWEHRRSNARSQDEPERLDRPNAGSSGPLGERSDNSAPDHYVWCSDLPLDMSDEHEWDGCVFVEEGSGRDGKKTSTSGLES